METKHSIRVRVDQDHYHIKSKIFSGGEIHVDIDALPASCNDYSIKARLQGPEDYEHFFMLSDALSLRYPNANGTMVIPYLPYARQDRMCSPGQHFGLANFVSRLCTLRQLNLVVYDLHSDVSLNMLSGFYGAMRNGSFRHVEQHEIIEVCEELDTKLKNHTLMLVSPDKGAINKTAKIGAKYGITPACGFKTRDPKTGVLTGFSVNVEDFGGQDVLITDDIADGGGTFIGLAQELKKRNVGKIYLYVTHGIFSKGLSVFDGVIDGIYSSDSFYSEALSEQHAVKHTTIKL